MQTMLYEKMFTNWKINERNNMTAVDSISKLLYLIYLRKHRDPRSQPACIVEEVLARIAVSLSSRISQTS